MTKSGFEFANKRLERYEQKKRAFSEKASDTSRTLALAEIAIFWMYHHELEYPGREVYVGITFLVFFLFCDVFQYLTGLIAYKNLCKKTRVKISQQKWTSDDINNKGVNKYSNIFFWGKVLFLFIASCILILSSYFAIF